MLGAVFETIELRKAVTALIILKRLLPCSMWQSSHGTPAQPNKPWLLLKVFLNTTQVYQRFGVIRWRSVMFKMPVSHLTKYLVGHLKLVMLNSLNRSPVYKATFLILKQLLEHIKK